MRALSKNNNRSFIDMSASFRYSFAVAFHTETAAVDWPICHQMTHPIFLLLRAEQ